MVAYRNGAFQPPTVDRETELLRGLERMRGGLVLSEVEEALQIVNAECVALRTAKEYARANTLTRAKATLARVIYKEATP